MTIGLLFWIIMIVWFIFGAWQSYPVAASPSGRFVFGGHLLLFILFLLLGIHAFGWPIKG